ncbi:MAG: CHAP domain-containing protein [candidate division WOR-3 bacterium]|nr:CHAP domain-containing protein [candidate division WOR-3 bacterium]
MNQRLNPVKVIRTVEHSERSWRPCLVLFCVVLAVGNWLSAGELSPWGTLVGEFSAVPAYSNGAVGNGVYDTYGYRYQCVEYVNRFYVQMFAHKNMHGMGNAGDYYDNYQELELERYANGGTEPPKPGDILCSNGGTYGHVAIVRAVTSDSVRVIEQNWNNDHRDSSVALAMDNSGGHYTVAHFSPSYPVQGWLRKPDLADYIHHVEDDWPECTRYGTQGYWHEYTFVGTSQPGADSSIGVCRGHMWWTISNGNTRDNYAIWCPSLLRDGYYEVRAFVPARYATTHNARYEIDYYGGTAEVTVDQGSLYGVFDSLGTFPFLQGSSGYVLLGDNTGESPDTFHIGFDDVVFIYRRPMNGVAEASSRGTIELTVSPNPFRSGVEVSYAQNRPGPATLRVYDCTGNQVRGLALPERQPGRYSARWDGTGETGQYLPAGSYFIRLVIPDGSSTRRVLKLP